MAKKTVSGGGGGSLGKSVDWHAALLAELRGPQIPPCAKTAADYVAESGAKRTRVQELLAREVKAGRMVRGQKIHAGKVTAFYWHASASA